MDFSFTDDQKAISELASQILTDRSSLPRLKAIEASPERYDREAWQDLAKAGLLGAGFPEGIGGSGGGLVELALLLEQQGRRVSQLPTVATLVSAGLPLCRFGSSALQQRWLPAVVRGEVVLTAALSELDASPSDPQTQAQPDGAGWRLTGVKTAVPYAEAAAAVLVPAHTPDGGILLCLVDPKAQGVSLERQEPMSWEPWSRMELTKVAVGSDAVLVGPSGGRDALQWVLERTTAALCAVASGVCQEALRLTAEYASNRKQFDKPIAMFQAVGQRMADCFIDNEAVQLTMWQAVTRLADEMPSAKEVATAKFWAADGGSRIGHAALHIHGGISIDVDFPIHRYFLWIKTLELTLGGATPQLVELGERLAAEPA